MGKRGYLRIVVMRVYETRNGLFLEAIDGVKEARSRARMAHV